jgi:hypothetical protein
MLDALARFSDFGKSRSTVVDKHKVLHFAVI